MNNGEGTLSSTEFNKNTFVATITITITIILTITRIIVIEEDISIQVSSKSSSVVYNIIDLYKSSKKIYDVKLKDYN